MARFRLYPTAFQVAGLELHRGQARYVWNLAVEQQSWWNPRCGPAPGYAEQNRQLTEARREFGWLASGGVIVQQQALRDFATAMANFFRSSHRRPSFRRPGRGAGFRIVAAKPGDVRTVNRRWSQVRMPKVGWVRFRHARAVPAAKSYRVTRDRAGRWHVAFAVIPEPVEAPGTGRVGGVDLPIGAMTRSARGTVEAPGRNVRQKAGLNRGILANASGLLVRRVEQKAPGRVERVHPAFTSQTCHACGTRDREARESQGVFRCRSCGYQANADVNAARNIALGHRWETTWVTARGGDGISRPANREPQHSAPPSEDV